MTSPTQRSNTCSNCFAEFGWVPFVQDGEEFCCAGCADGGPCICTYAGGPHVTETGTQVDQQAIAPGSHEHGSGVDEHEPLAEPGTDEEVSAASVEADGAPGPPGPPEPPRPPPAPGLTPDEEPPSDARLAIIMAAIAEMPLPVQEVVRARLATNASEDEIGEPLGLTGDEVRQLIRQGQAILDRTIGPGFQIRYIGAEETAAEAPSAPEFPTFPSLEQAAEEPETPADGDLGTPEAPEAPESPARPAELAPSDLGQLIARSVDSLTGVSAGEGPGLDAARETLSEALREAGNLFRLASERLEADLPPETPLRAALSEARDEEEPVALTVETPGDISQFFMALQAADSVQWARLDVLTVEKAEFRLVTNSMMGLVRDLMALEGDLRPSRLQMSGDGVTVELPPREPESAQLPGGAAPGPRFELAVDSFFGARHFVQSGAGQNAPHHHSYRVEASFVTSEPDDYGFVVGFAQIRGIVDRTVMEYSETLLNTEEPFLEIPATTENLARVFHKKISERLVQLNQPEVGLNRVRVWESPTNSATYTNMGTDAAASA